MQKLHQRFRKSKITHQIKFGKNNNNDNNMKEIIIRNGSVTSIVPVATKEKLENIKNNLEKIINTSGGTLTIENDNNTVTYPWLFLANSVIEYPKFD